MRAPWRMILGALAALAAFAASPLAGPVRAPEPSFGHAEVALQIALADIYCGERNRIFPAPQIFGDLTYDAATTELARYIPEKLGAADLAAACRLVAPYSNFHEFSISAFLKAALALPPVDTPLTLMMKMRGLVVAIVMLGAALFAYVRLGLVPIFMASAAAFILTAPIEPIAWSEYYFFLPAALILSIAVSAALGKVVHGGRAIAMVAFGAFAGAIFAIIDNLRTTYGLAFEASIIICAGAALALALVDFKGRRRRTLASVAAAAAAFLVSAKATDAVAFASFRDTDAAPEVEYHLFWHPLVLGLALPGTDFTRAEGIAWNDATGVYLARRIKPDSPTYGLVYEDTLKTYYLGLWRNHPGEMIKAYLAKIDQFGRAQTTVMKKIGYAGPFIALDLSGFVLAVALLLLLAAMVALFLRRGRAELAMLTIATVALLGLVGLEYVIVLTEFSATHNAAGLIAFILFEWCLVAAVIVGLRDNKSGGAHAA